MIKQKLEEAQEDTECEKGAIYDEDEDADGEIDLDVDSNEDDSDWGLSDNEDDYDNDLYDTKFDKVDEILFVQEKLSELQQTNGQHY